jgi:hypothetical protein
MSETPSVDGSTSSGSPTTQVLLTQLSSPAGDHPSEPDWVVGQFRFADVARALRAGKEAEAVDAPHPMTASWTNDLGLVLPGPSWAEQLDQLYDEALRTPRLTTPDLVGRPSRIREVARRLGRGSNDTERLESAARHLGVHASWISHVVRMDTAP